MPLITRKIVYDLNGKVISDIIYNHYTGEVYPTPERKINPSRRDEK